MEQTELPIIDMFPNRDGVYAPLKRTFVRRFNCWVMQTRTRFALTFAFVLFVVIAAGLAAFGNNMPLLYAVCYSMIITAGLNTAGLIGMLANSIHRQLQRRRLY